MKVEHAQLESAGFAIFPGIVPASTCDRIGRLLDQLSEGRAGSRALLKEDWCRDLAGAISQHPEIEPLLPPSAVAVQCTLFEKSPQQNWLVAFHQDQSMPVAARVESREYSGWSEKDGMTFVQPPAEVLAQMLALRLQIDDPDGTDGALRVLPGSHRHGKLTQAEVANVGQRPRRVLHFLFGPATLPHGLRWPD